MQIQLEENPGSAYSVIKIHFAYVKAPNTMAIDYIFCFVSRCSPYYVAGITATFFAAVILFLDQYWSRSSVSLAKTEIQSSSDGRLRRPVGPLEKGLINGFDKRHIPMIVVLLRLKSKIHLDPEKVRQALVLLAKRYPLLRMKICKESRNGEPVTEYFTEVEDPSEINFKVVNDFNGDELECVFEREFETPFDLNVGPLWRAVLLDEIKVDGAKDAYKNAIIFSFLHVVTDGRSILLSLEQFFRYLTMVCKGQKPHVTSMPFRPSTGVLMQHRCRPSLLEKLFFKATSWIPNIKTVLKIPSPENLYLASYPPVSIRDPAAPDKTSVVYREYSFEETRELIKACQVVECSVHGAITAALHIAMAKILHKGKAETAMDPLYLKSSYSVDIRKECRPAIESSEFVLCVSSFRTEIEVSPWNKNFWKFAQQCARQVQWAFFTGQHHTFLKQCHLKLTTGKQLRAAQRNQQDPRVFNLSNLGRYEWKAAENGPYRLDGLAGSVSLRPSGLVFGFMCATINGKLRFTNSYNKRAVRREQAVDFLELSLKILQRACDEVSCS